MFTQAHHWPLHRMKNDKGNGLSEVYGVNSLINHLCTNLNENAYFTHNEDNRHSKKVHYSPHKHICI
jgi:hypothetical protein